MIIYCSETDPLFVDATSKGDFFPTIYSLQMCPNLLAGIVRLHQGIEKFVFKGNPIDWKGVNKVEVLREFRQDDVVTICDAQGSVIGIGAISKNSIEISSGKLTEFSGAAVYILTFRDDFL